MVEGQQKIVRTTVRIPVSLHKALTDEVQRRKYTERRISIDRAIAEALEAWLSTDIKSVPSGTPVPQPVHSPGEQSTSIPPNAAARVLAHLRQAEQALVDGIAKSDSQPPAQPRKRRKGAA